MIQVAQQDKTLSGRPINEGLENDAILKCPDAETETLIITETIIDNDEERRVLYSLKAVDGTFRL